MLVRYPVQLEYLEGNRTAPRVRVPPDTCLAFQMYWLEGLSTAAVAARLGLKPRQVQKRCNRVLKLP